MTGGRGAKPVDIRARVLDGPLAASRYAIRDGRAARAPREVTLGRGALDALGARIGERVTLRVDGRPVTLPSSAATSSPTTTAAAR